MFDSLQGACDRMIKPKESYDPRPEVAAVYDEAYGKYVDLYDAVCPIFDRG
jgi:sugar (pentulose or hexulose) kinase